MHTLQIQLRYEASMAERLSRGTKAKAEAQVQQLFREMKVPNLAVIGQIRLELGDSMVSLQCNAKRRSSLYRDFTIVKEALADGRFMDIWERKGLTSVQLKETNSGQNRSVVTSTALGVKLEREESAACAVAACQTTMSASAAPANEVQRFVPPSITEASSNAASLPLSLSELLQSASPFDDYNPYPFTPLLTSQSAQQLQTQTQPSTWANAASSAFGGGYTNSAMYSSSAGGMALSSAYLPSSTWYDYDAKLSQVTHAAPAAIPPLPSRPRLRISTTTTVPAATSAGAVPPLPHSSNTQSLAPGQDAMVVCGESGPGDISTMNTNPSSSSPTTVIDATMAISPEPSYASPIYMPTSPRYKPTTPRTTISGRNTTRNPGEADDVLKGSPPIISKRPLSKSSLGKRGAEGGCSPRRGSNADRGREMRRDIDAEESRTSFPSGSATKTAIGATKEADADAEQAAFVANWLNPLPSTFDLSRGTRTNSSLGSSSDSETSSSSSGPSTPPSVVFSSSLSSTTSSVPATAPPSSASSQPPHSHSHSSMPSTRTDVSRLTIKRPRQYAANSSPSSSSSEDAPPTSSFLESRRAKRTGGRNVVVKKPYEQVKRRKVPQRRTSRVDEDDEGEETGSESEEEEEQVPVRTVKKPRFDSPGTTTTTTTAAAAAGDNYSMSGDESEGTLVTPGSGGASASSSPKKKNTKGNASIQNLSDAELLSAWRETGGRLFDSIQELVDLKRAIYDGVGERLVAERERECGHCKTEFENDLKKLGRKIFRKEYKRLSRLL